LIPKVIDEDSPSASGRSALPRACIRLKLPTVTSPLNLKLSPGSRVTIEMAPPMVLRPNSVPCGPFRISMRSTSSRSWLAPTVRAR
jgi:hypothetical protein